MSCIDYNDDVSTNPKCNNVDHYYEIYIFYLKIDFLTITKITYTACFFARFRKVKSLQSITQLSMLHANAIYSVYDFFLHLHERRNNTEIWEILRCKRTHLGFLTQLLLALLQFYYMGYMPGEFIIYFLLCQQKIQRELVILSLKSVKTWSSCRRICFRANS